MLASRGAPAKATPDKQVGRMCCSMRVLCDATPGSSHTPEMNKRSYFASDSLSRDQRPAAAANSKLPKSAGGTRRAGSGSVVCHHDS